MVEAIVLDSGGLNTDLHVGDGLDSHNGHFVYDGLDVPPPEGGFRRPQPGLGICATEGSNNTWDLSEDLLGLLKSSKTPSRNDENWPCVEAT